jgi:hypothetical protein
MRLLDVVAGKVLIEAKAPVVDLFNIDDCKHLRDFGQYIPHLRNVFQTPVVGIWQDGEFVGSKQGYAARDTVARQFGSGSAEIVQFVQNWIEARSRSG